METPNKPVINPAIEPILREFKAALQVLYGDRLRDVILYGSYARGDYDDESDIDLMVVLNDEEVKTYCEIRNIVDVETDISLKYGMPLSPLPVSHIRFSTSWVPVYQEARREGIRL